MADVAAVSKCCESVRLLGHDMAPTMCGLEVKHECRMSTTEPQKAIAINITITSEIQGSTQGINLDPLL